MRENKFGPVWLILQEVFMGEKFTKLIFGVIFLAASFSMAGQLKAATVTEDILPDINIIRSLEEKDQVNMYKTVVDETGYQNITLSFDDTQKDKVKNGWTLKVYDENKEEIYRVEGIKSQFKSGNFSFAKNKAISISVESTTSGYLFMPKGVEYNLNFHTYPADDYESEPNNKYTDANEIEMGSYIKGNLISKSDEDYYVARAGNKGYAVLSLEIPDFEPDKMGNGWDLEIYDKNKSLIYKEENIKKDTKFPELPLTKGQDIYIRIKAKTGIIYSAPETVEYKLNAEFVKTDKWEMEDNNSFSKANKLKSTISANILNENDEDYFTFNAENTGNYKVSLNTGDNVGKEYKVEIFVNNKSKAKVNRLIISDKNFTFKAKKGQKVWVKVSGVPGNAPIGNKYIVRYKPVKNAKKTKVAAKKAMVTSKKQKS